MPPPSGCAHACQSSSVKDTSHAAWRRARRVRARRAQFARRDLARWLTADAAHLEQGVKHWRRDGEALFLDIVPQLRHCIWFILESIAQNLAKQRPRGQGSPHACGGVDRAHVYVC